MRITSFVRNLTGRLPLDVAVGGRKRDLLFRVLDPLFRAAVDGDIIETPWGGLELDCTHPPERLLSYLFENIVRYYEKSELGRYLHQVAEPGATFVDVGANLGIYALVARRLGFNTVLIEPEPRHGAFLKRNEAICGKVLAIALSDQPGALPLYYDRQNPGATSLFPCASYVKGAGLVPVRTFTEIAAAGELGDLTAIRIVKIDVEGLEAEVVTGMIGVLKTGWRPRIWCEVRGDRSGRNGGSYRRVRELLRRFDYVARELRNGRDLPMDEARLADREVFDLLFTVRGA